MARTTFTPEDFGLKTYCPIYTYVIDLNERGRFLAHVDNDRDRTVFTLSNEDSEDGSLWITEFGYMRHTEDISGLEDYLKMVGIMPKNGQLRKE